MNRGSVFLFLQGVASPFFARLATELERQGHCCLRINFCPGDRLFWRRGNAFNYSGRYDEWPAFFREFVQANKVTDLVIFSDTRPLHRLACREAKHLDIRCHVFEEGYLRPYCITLDLGGTNAYSQLPRDAEEYLKLSGSQIAWQPFDPVPISMFKRATWDITNHALNISLPWLHPYYESHREHHPLLELKGWTRRVLRRHLFGERRRHLKLLESFLASETPFFLLPLQLDSDAQIVEHSDFANVGEALVLIFNSFASHAPEGMFLVVKAHPLDNDMVPRGRQARSLASRHGILDRVIFVDGGHLPTLLTRARGVVTVNSTVATSAFEHGCPVKALGRAIYNFDGLASQQPLEEFWHAPRKPDRRVNEAFKTALLENCLVRGSFYSKEGIAVGVAGAVNLLAKRIRSGAANRTS